MELIFLQDKDKNTMKKLGIIILLLSMFVCQEGKTQEAQEFTLYGWVNANLLYDSRQSMAGIDNLYTLFPLPEKLDANGNDLNGESSCQLSTIITRVGGTFKTDNILNGTLGARIEIDFSGGATGSGVSSTNSIRFRHAYITWQKDKTQLLLGRTWHPIFCERSFPITQNIGIGSPFQPFNRSPQLRLTHNLNENFIFQGTAIYQTQYQNIGPDGKSAKYQRDSEIPNLHAKLIFQDKHILLGAGYDFKMMKPRRNTSPLGDVEIKYVSDEHLTSSSVYGFMKIFGDKFHIKTRYMLGENNTDLLMPGGIGVKTYNPTTGAETYTSSKHSTAYTDLSFGKGFKVGLFVGYMKNHGYKDDLYTYKPEKGQTTGILFGRTQDVDKAYRFSPRIERKIKNFSIGLEYENNTACFGDIDYTDKGKVKDSQSITNHRFMCSVYYYFKKKL